MGTSPRVIGVFGRAKYELVHRAFNGVVRYADEVGGFVVRDFRSDDVNVNTQLSPPWTGRVDGVIVYEECEADQSDRDVAEWVLSGGAPAMSAGADWLDPRIPCFHNANQAVAEMAANHLAECGCQSFLYLDYAGSTTSAIRGRFFRETLARRGHKAGEHVLQSKLAGLNLDEALVRGETDLTEQLRNLPKPLGVWTINDNYALGIYVLCEELGLAIPEMVKVLGLNDLAIARTLRPTLSSIRTNDERVGWLAMQALHDMLDGRQVPSTPIEIPPTELIVQGSTVGALPAKTDLQMALNYIARHACAGLTVEQLVETMGISRRTLEERFHRIVGRSPGEEIQRVRLERAKELLGRTKLSIARIAGMIGFEESTAFTKFFNREVSVSPREYRHNENVPPENA